MIDYNDGHISIYEVKDAITYWWRFGHVYQHHNLAEA
jgi:hypothetical protein